MNKLQILITGANGFIGRALCDEAWIRGYAVRGITRTQCDLSKGITNGIVGSIDGDTIWLDQLVSCELVVHLAARAHIMEETLKDPLAEYRRINVRGTLNLARQAAISGVKRFVFISSIGVNGSETFERSFLAEDNVAPHSPYAISKYEAELGLQEIALQTGMEVVIIRPPLVYGPKAPGNFGSLVRWLSCGLPLPLGSIQNKRSFIALDNLVDFILLCLAHPGAANQIFLASDGEDVSTTDLLRRMGKAIGKPARLIPAPTCLLKFSASIFGRGEVAKRLCSSLQIDIEKARLVLGWNPPLGLDQGLKKAIKNLAP